MHALTLHPALRLFQAWAKLLSVAQRRKVSDLAWAVISRRLRTERFPWLRNDQCRVEVWRGGFRLGISVSGPFGCRCLTSFAMLRFHTPLIKPDLRVIKPPL